ncbi:group I intron-associated PD-(D/E)XK endonuclease [Paenibacillus sp. ACRRX]|uniref:group I intron-associated PD-(D/E)XK endonuclease n=1 Tax=Paenibacillus sp. ACRRX TaxID=2918206 RepID=UPI001EF6B390|nr:group I intron-associated PD-(D/E)XK endonuclease [Paenibacillus sp. ACRRX]MCG7407734.1 group I intron-associated PD-(D/E)XK endonuclease [Paenibacillus sp. ACRRX]
MASESTNIGTHSELRVMTALLANGYEVSKPIAPEVYDLQVHDPRTGEFFRVQVKTARYRERENRLPAYVVDARKGNGDPYTLRDAEYIAGVTPDAVYLIPNKGQIEYWAQPSLIDAKWMRLEEAYQRN